MEILIAIPSELEWQQIQKLWAENSALEAVSENHYRFHHLHLHILISGVGMLESSYRLSEYLSQNTIDIALMIGVAGGSQSTQIGEAAVVQTEELMDGVWEDGYFKTVFDLGLADPDALPYRDGVLLADLPKLFWAEAPSKKSITVGTIIDDVQWCEERLAMAEATLESMEGAAFYYVCGKKCVSSLQVRGISNHVGVRDKSLWKIEEALQSANVLLLQILQNIANEKNN